MRTDARRRTARFFPYIIALAALLSALFGCAAAEELTITLPRDIRGFQDNTVTVNCPADGTLTLQVLGDNRVWRVIAENEPVRAGENTFVWDGLAPYCERMDETTYTMRAELTQGGSVLTAEKGFTLLKCRQALVWAMGTSDVLERGGEKWYLEYDMIRDGVMIMEHYRSDDLSEPFYTRKINAVGKSIRRFEWDTKWGRELLPAGAYVLRLYAEENPERVSEVHVTIKDEPEPALPVAVTGRIIPEEGADDETIWAMMTAPAVVVNLSSNKKSQDIYAEPSTASRSLGTVHGLSQSLEVLELRNDGWAKVAAWNHEDIAFMEGYIPIEKLKTVQPKTDFGLLIDKRAQTLTVFREGKRIGSLTVSTGMVHGKKIYQETTPGSFLTQEHMSNFSMNGCKYDYVIRFDGGNLIHQSPWSLKKGRRDYSVGSDPIGGKASHGCVRMQPEPSADGQLNAYWVFTHIRFNTRLIILDDPEASQLQAAAALAGKDPDRSLAELPDAPALEAGQTELIVTAGGDVVPGPVEKRQEDAGSLAAAIRREGAAYPFSSVADRLLTDDVTLVNLEGVLQDDASGEKTKDDTAHYRGGTAFTQALTSGGIDAVNLANNHIGDYGEGGELSTVAALEGAGIGVSGGGRLWIYEKNGVKIGFAGCRESVWRRDRTLPAADIAALRQAGCSVVIYSCHWGEANKVTHNDVQRRMAEAVAEAGADIIVGTHPHALQGIEEVNGAVVLWSLGNLMHGGTDALKTRDAALAELRLRFAPDGSYLGVMVRWIPILTSSRAGVNDYHPVYAQGVDAIRVMAKLQADSEILIKEEMYFAKP